MLFLLKKLAVVAERCGENEEYQQCGTACPETCLSNDTKTCTVECVPGCFCKSGYVLNRANGTCVKRETCGTSEYVQCPENEIFTYCGGCEGTCQQQFVQCPDICGSPRCECPAEKNFVRDDFGCVTPRDCFGLSSVLVWAGVARVKRAMYCVRTPRNLTPWHLHAFLLRHSSSHTPAPGRIYSQKQLFEEKRAAMQANHPEKYALASQFMANRADRPINFKSDDPK
ncbi:unnamed protein product, partial [Gongylonema pulchrum]|uniref:TIL domain-containing protein n=1 Tax=Gongylonema pulchrum TaxID=637853 RepID=A0A183CZ07_9BILA